MRKKSNKWYRGVYLLGLSLSYFFRFFPLKAWVFMGRGFGLLFYFLAFQQRRIALRNLKFAFGKEKAENEIVSLARKNFQQFGMIACEWARLKYITQEELQSLVYIEGKEHLLAAKKKSPSIILLGAHFGNWEYAHLLYASIVNHLNFIVRAIDIPFLERERVAYNENFGVRVLYQKNGLRPAIRNLKKGEDLVIFADRQAGSKEAITCQFFGKETSSLTLVPTLAQRFQLPIVPMFTVRSRDRVHHRMIFFPELKIEPGNKEKSILEGTQRQSDIIESVIREYPDHWVWLHKRWKAHHRYLYTEALAKRKRRREKRKTRQGANN
jgi:KDO2-lipid IV(A) lauroyltransferase